jgi:hypothetical protein
VPDKPRKRTRYLDEPYIGVELDLALATRSLSQLASHATSPLPGRLRHRLARIVRQLIALQQELRHFPGRIEQERTREDQRDNGL